MHISIYPIVKRIFDICISLVGLALLSPLFLVIGALIKVDSDGPAFYRGLRIGRFGKPFYMFKFRTMVENADRIGGPSTPEDDQRLTRFGKFLRKYKLDELPQLINVLMGEMSIVGPRPEVKQYVDIIEDQERKIILSVRPGMTDYASLWDFNEGERLKGSIDPEKTYLEEIWPEKIRLQLKYIKEQSLFTDIRIIVQTVMALFR